MEIIRGNMRNQLNMLFAGAAGVVLGIVAGTLFGRYHIEQDVYQYSSYEPFWADKEYSFKNDDVLISWFEDDEEVFERYMKELMGDKKSHEPYNLYYRCYFSDGERKYEKYTYQYMEGYEVKDTVLIPDVPKYVIVGEEADIMIDGMPVHVISHESSDRHGEPIKKFAEYLIDCHFLPNPYSSVGVEVRNVQGADEPIVKIDLSGVEGAEKVLDCFIAYSPIIPSDMEMDSLEGADSRIIELAPDWYFGETISERFEILY